MADGQVHPFNKGRIQPSREAYHLQGKWEVFRCSEPHHVRHSNQLTSLVAFSTCP